MENRATHLVRELLWEFFHEDLLREPLHRNDGGDYYNWIRVRVKESLALGLRDSIGARVYVTLREPSKNQKDEVVDGALN